MTHITGVRGPESPVASTDNQMYKTIAVVVIVLLVALIGWEIWFYFSTKAKMDKYDAIIKEKLAIDVETYEIPDPEDKEE